MSDNVHLVEFVAATICGGVILDWALFGRLKMTLGGFWDRDEVRYRDLPYWRLVLIIAGSALVGISRAPEDLLILPLWLGIALFVAGNIYGVLLALRR